MLRLAAGSPCSNTSEACSEGDMMADLSNCAWYYECDGDSKWVKFSCEDVQGNIPLYSAWAEKCQPAHLVDCDEEDRCDGTLMLKSIYVTDIDNHN